MEPEHYKDCSKSAEAVRARNRVLAYLCSLGLEPVGGLELALECLRRAETPGPLTVENAVTEMFGLLREKGLHPEAAGPAVPASGAMPAFVRRSMISEELDISVTRMVTRLLTGGLRAGKKDSGSGRADSPDA